MHDSPPAKAGAFRGLRPARTDLWLAGGLAVISVSVSLLAAAGPPYRDMDVPGVAYAVVSALCLAWRRRTPLLILITVCTLLLANTAAGHAATFVQWPAWIALYSQFSAHGGRWPRCLGASIAALAVAGYLVFTRDPASPLDLAGIAMCFLISMIAGDAARSRRAFATADRGRALSETREQAMRTEHVLIEERVRLARELHDALGHAVNVMVMQAGVGRRVFESNPAFGHEALQHIETLGRSALEELDRLLRVLHTGDDSRRITPAPSETDLSELVERVRAAGRELQLNTGPVHLPPSASRALHRIIQEAITNALRHTSAGPIRIDLTQADDTVLLEVTSQGRALPAAEPGRGLVNMRERARLEGGDLQAGPVADGFRVRATLPALPAPAAT